jgi:DNA mismatch endonuclease (patch repair protein)
MGTSRSKQMSRIRSTNTKPEKVLRSALWARGLRYRLHAKTPMGRPDVVFPTQQVAVFIDGCFWHGCPDHYVRPRSRVDFWSNKLRENVERDSRQTLALEAAGWRVIRFWEHTVFTELEHAVNTVVAVVKGGEARPTPRWCVIEVHPLDEAGNQERRILVDLRDMEQTRVVEQKRHTRKWTRPKGKKTT